MDRERNLGRLEAPRTDTATRRHPPPSTSLRTCSLRGQARFVTSGGSSACSSMLSSLESVESNTSEGAPSNIWMQEMCSRQNCLHLSLPVNNSFPRCRFEIPPWMRWENPVLDSLGHIHSSKIDQRDFLSKLRTKHIASLWPNMLNCSPLCPWLLWSFKY